MSRRAVGRNLVLVEARAENRRRVPLEHMRDELAALKRRRTRMALCALAILGGVALGLCYLLIAAVSAIVATR